MQLEKKEFEAVVAKITRDLIASLPEDLRQQAETVLIVTREKPSREQAGPENDFDLLGIYEGIPLNERSVGFPSENDRIILFRKPLLDMCRSKGELKDEIRITLIHELGHFFGFDENELAERGLD